MQVMQNHASVRSFTSESVSTELLEEIISCGQAAASSSFIQAYSVIRVQDVEKRQAIAEAAGNQRWVIQTPEFLVFCADMQRIQYCSEKTAQGDLGGQTEHFIAATVDVALMAQNVMLAAESAGLGGVFIGGIRNDPQTVSECLDLPELVYPVFGMCLGWPEQKPQHKPRMPLGSILHQDSYQQDRVKAQVDDYDRIMQEYYASRLDNVKTTNWSEQTANAVQGKKREHMLKFLQSRGFLKL